MLYNLIALGVIILLVIIITIILARKIPYVRTMDVRTIAEEKEMQTKERILVQRIRRRANQGKRAVSKLMQPSTQRARSFFQRAYDWMVSLEKKYQREASQKNLVLDSELEYKMRELLREADTQWKRGDYVEAEKNFIEVISLDAANKRAYEGLGKLYRQQKEWQQAIQTYKYVLKLDQKMADESKKKKGEYDAVSALALTEDFWNLGELYTEMAEYPQALKFFEKAYGINPNHPKTLDLLIQTCILVRDRSSATDYFRKLQEVNPENQKLLEYKDTLDSM